MGQNENRQASEPALSPEQQRKAKRTEIAARIPTKGKNKLWTQAKAEDVAEYIATLTDDAAVQQATADKYIADIKEKQAKMDAIEALELNDDIAFWESVKGLLAPVETQTEEAPEALPAPTAENEMQPVAEVAQQPMTEVQSEDAPAQAGEPVGNSEQLNQSGVNTGTRLTNEASNEEHPSVSKAELQDALAFAEAYSLNTVEAYQAYLDRSPEGAYRDGARNGMWVLEGAEEANSEAIERAMDVISQAPSGVYADNQGNPVDADGKMVIDEVNSIDEITDEDFETPTRNVQLPAIPENVANAIGTNGRPIVIKKNVFEKNGNTHVELEPEDSRNILRSALYNPNLVGSTQPIRRPDYKVAIRTGEQNAVVVLDVYQEKDFVEIVGWRMVNEKGLAKMQRQAEREGGQFLILSPNDGSAAALSALPLGLSSADESTASVSNSQENSVKSGENTQNSGEKDVIEEMREQNRVAEERKQRAGVPPRPSDYSSAINAEDTEAQKAWEDKFNDFLAKLTIDDLPTIDGTISSMQGNKEAIKAGDPGGYKENPNYKVFDYIEKALKKRKRKLEQSSTNGEKSQEIEDYSTTGGEETAPSASQQGELVDIEINDETRADKATEEAVLKYYSPEPINIATATSKQMSSDGTFDIFQFDDLVEFAQDIGAVSPIKIEPKIMGGKMMTIASAAERSAIDLEAAYRSGNRKKIEREEKEQSLLSDSLAKIQTIKDIEGGISYYKRKKEEYKDKPTAYRAFEFLENLSKKELAKKKAELQRGSLSLDGENPAFRAATEKTMQALENTGVEVVMATEEQVKTVMGIAEMQKRTAPETVSVQDEHLQTVVSSADGAKVLKNLDNAIVEYENDTKTKEKTFLGNLAKVLGAKRHGSNSQYATFEAVNGKVFTIRLANHNAKTSTFDNHDENEGISIVVTAQDNNGVTNDGNAHLVEFFYDAIKLRKADGKPLVEILKSIKQALYSGEYKDNTGLAIREEVNIPEFHRVYHGSGAKFDRFDHSFMGTGEGAQAYGWGTYVTEVEGIGKSYAEDAANPFVEEDIVDIKIHFRYYPLGIDVDTVEDAKRHLANLIKDFEGTEEWEDVIDEIEELRELTVKWEDLEKMKGRTRNLYTVEIPDDNGSNYLHWEKPVSDNVKGMLYAQIRKEGVGKFDFADQKFWAGKSIAFEDGELLYDRLTYALGSDKAASEFLSRAGFVGITYPAQATTGGREDGARNYVIFDESDAQITDRVEFLRTSDGTVYGWTVNGRIFLTPEGVNPNTPVHEYTHLWASAIEQRDPELWAEVVEAMKLSPVWAEVMADEAYRDIWNDEGRTASEVLARLTGNENYRRTMQEAALSENDPTQKFSLIAAWGRVKRVLAKFWNRVREMLDLPVTGEPGNDVPAWERFVNSAIGDFYGGMNPNVKNSPMERMFIGEQGAKNLDNAQEATTRLDNLSIAREMEAAEKDAKNIKMATGWERGADGKWRYETENVRVKDTINIEGNELKRREEDMLWTSGLLKNVIDAPGLFEAYPELGKVRLDTDPITGDYPSRGEYNPKRNMITIHANEVKYLNSILNHEIQHAIQRIEGFAKGGNENTADVLSGKARSWAWRNALKETAEEYPELAGTTALQQKLIDEYKAEGLESYIPSEEQRTKGFNLYVRGYDNEGYEEAYNQMAKVVAGENYATYRRLAGEVESRNVQKRMNMSAEERRASLAAETEDVAREDQIFLYDNLGESAMVAESERQKPFHDMIDDLYSNGNVDKSKYAMTYFHVAETPAFMENIGLIGAEFTIPFKAISTHIGKDADHKLTADIWHELPNALQHPFLITKYGEDGRFRIYTTLLHNGKYVAVGVDVKRINQGRNKPIVEINSIKTVFAKTGRIGENEAVVCYDERITPEQEALLNGRNFRQYPTIQELSADKGSENISNSQEDNDIRFRSVGGNSGYVGYSMSKRAAEAREEGRYPKTDFKKEYNVPQQTLEALVEAGIIDNSEWHHTSKMGNRTTFYGWAEEDFAERYARNKKEIDKLVKEVNANIAEIEKEKRAFLESWKGYEYPETFDWDAYSRRARELEELPYNERKDILHSEFPETAEADKDDRRRSEFSDKFYKKKREQKKRLQDLLEERIFGEASNALFRLTSEKGAAALDAKEGVTTRMDALELAKTMEARGYEAWEIEVATGWRQIKGGQWRYDLGKKRNNSKTDVSPKQRNELAKHRVEEIFGGIWIDDAEEFAKFASAVNHSPFEEDGEGIAFTDNYFYAYYLNIDGQVIPFASVYLNSLESQEVVNQVNQEIKDGRKEKGVKEYIDRAVIRARSLESQDNADNGNNRSTPNRGRNDSVDSNISRKGRYYDRPSLYVKTQRADRFGIKDGYSREGTDEEINFANDPISKALGKPRGTRKQRREFAQRERQRMAERVERLAKRSKYSLSKFLITYRGLYTTRRRVNGV